MAISLKISPIFHQWLLLFLPYQNLSHFRTLLNLFVALRLYHNVTAKRKIYLLYLIYTVYCFQNLYLWVFLPPPVARLRQGDWVSLAIQTDTFYLVTFLQSLMTMYFMGVMFFTLKPDFLRLLEDTLFVDSHRTLTGVAYGRYTEQETVRFFMLVLINLLHSFILFIDAVLLFLIYSQFIAAIQSPGELFGSPLQTPFTFIWNIMCMLVGTFTTATIVPLYAKIIMYVAALAATQVCVLFRRLYHSETFLAVYRRKIGISISWAPFSQYLTHSEQTFGILFQTNEIGGRLFLAFLLVNMPISAWALVEMALGGLSQQASMALSFISSHELFGCILLHWAFAKFTKRLHAPSKTLLTLNASLGHRVGNFRARLLLHHTIVRLHTKAKYGFTYGSVGGLITMDSFAKCTRVGNFRARLLLHHTIVRLPTKAKYGFTYGSVGGLITMGSFAKCMLLYTELLMYAYKFVCDI